MTERASETIRVAIVDDHPLFREGVAATLSLETDIDVVGEGSSAADALKLSTSLLPDILLLDIAMPGGGLTAAQNVAAACPVTKIVMLTFSEAEDDVLASLRAGARGYILKGVAGRELKRHVRAIYAGEVFVTPSLASAMLQELATDPSPKGPLDELSERERQILELVATGLSNKEVGQKLELTEKTIKHYMSNILQKLQVRNRVEAALLAHKLGS